MNLIEIAKQPLINRTELARLMYPGIPNSLDVLTQKLENRNGKRLTKTDKVLLNTVLQEFFDSLMMSKMRGDELDELIGR